jgi:hypothetical protein
VAVAGTYGSVDVVVRFELGLVNHVVAVVELGPVVIRLHLHLLLLVHFMHLLLLLDGHLLVVHALVSVHLLLRHLLLLILHTPETPVTELRQGSSYLPSSSEGGYDALRRPSSVGRCSWGPAACLFSAKGKRVSGER